MASNVFPMLSSSPPPIDDCPDDDDDDDEFGNFTSANIPFDSSFDSPVAVDKLKQFKSGDNGVNDANISNDIKHFTAFSNSASNSPQEFVPNFPDENEHSKNGFIPIKNPTSKISIKKDTDMKDPVFSNQLDVTSHKSEPCALNSSNDSEDESECSEDYQDSSVKCSLQNNSVKSAAPHLEDTVDEFSAFQSKSVLPCDLTKERTEELSEDESRTHIACDDSKDLTSDAVPDIQFIKDSSDVETHSLDESNFSSDKFTCDFNFQDQDKNFDRFDGHLSEREFSPNAMLQNSKLSDCEHPVEDKAGSSEEICKPTSSPVCENFCDFSDNEFDDFQSCGDKLTFVQENAESSDQTKPADDFEYDDFQDFQYSNEPKEEADEFADFQDFSKANATDADDFADFSAAAFDSNKTQELSASSEFAEFEEATFSAPSESSFQATSASQKSVDTLSTVVNAIFPLAESPSESVTSDELSSQILEQSNKSRRLWEKLHEVEQTPGLRFQWGVSQSFQQLLRSVNVDYHSILRTSSVPIFASGLSLLEPVKGLANSVNHESEDRNQIPKPKDPIPPVEFDWNSSGLVNPLDFGTAASTLMDLSFLSSVETDASGITKDHSFESELLKPSPVLACPESSSKTQILEQLLSKNVSSLPSSKLTRRPSDLSHEAVRVLDQLPDLSFMQAKVLMFPISSKT